MDLLLLVLFLIILLISLKFYESINSTTKEVIPKYSAEELQWFKKEVIYKCLENEIQTVSLNPADDKSHCYQKGVRIYCIEMIRTSDIENFHKELIVNEAYLKEKLQETLYQQYMFGQIPKIKVLGAAVHNGKFIVAMELLK